MQAPSGHEQAQALFDRFARWRPALSRHPLTDFSARTDGIPSYCEVAPRSVEAVGAIVREAHGLGVPLRCRAQGHSLNGSSLPRPGELLLRLHGLQRLRFEVPGTVTAGAGIVLWMLQGALRAHGFDLPVLNDGYPGPSVGGFVCAGGFGPGSAEHGGLWDNVTQVLLVDGRGELRRIGAGDAEFPWLFGSMGQLGVIVEVTLAIVPLAAGRAAYPQGKTLTLPAMDPIMEVPPEYAVGEDERLFWFTLFVPQERVARAHGELQALEQRHATALRYAERYRYPIRRRGVDAPLVYPDAAAFTATGAWGWLLTSAPQALQKLLEFERDFMALATGTPGYRRYVQSELPAGPETYVRAFGEGIYNRFREVKARFDPGSILNRGSVFPGP